MYPYKKSINSLLEFNDIWECALVGGGTNEPDAIISMPLRTFKRVLGVNPWIGDYDIPQGTEYFMTSFEVKQIVS